MVNLLRLAYPTPGAIERRTADADAAIGVQIAADGRVHHRLLALGYTAENANRYVLDGRTIDLLVPSGTGLFTHEEHGGRMFDAAPGLILDPESPHLEITVTVTHTNDETNEISARVPTLERAVIMKSYALESRSKAKDYVDLHNLLNIADAREADEIGGWRLGGAALSGTRKDAARILARKLRSPATRRMLQDSGVVPARLQALAVKLIPGMLTLQGR